MPTSFQDFIKGIDGFNSWNHPEKIRFFAWFLHRHIRKDRFSGADIRDCYDRLYLVKPTNMSPYLKKMLLHKEAIKEKLESYYLTNHVRDRFEAMYCDLPVNSRVIRTEFLVKIEQAEPFVDLDRIKELRMIESIDFDMKRLIRLCEELNESYGADCYLAVTMLTRSILDHVPPIFGFKTFNEVANNCAVGGSATRKASFQKSIEHLPNSSRNIADAYLHLPIRNKEVLPTKTQVNFSHDLDVLLQEIVRSLNKAGPHVSLNVT